MKVDDANVAAAKENLPNFKELQTLVLKAFDVKSIGPLLAYKVGHNLRRLDLHYNYNTPGINLITVGKWCPFLTEFSVSDSLITAPDMKNMPKKNRLFSHLSSLKLLRVSYSHQDDWEAILRQVKELWLKNSY